jgi:protein-S-isoprenylcysteine O-methyltransferase Ste14
MASWRGVLKPTAWFFYFLFVFEILFMISPLALHFYSVYGPFLNLLNSSPRTAWLTQFFLPHFTTTGSPVLDFLPVAGRILIVVGSVFFLAAALPLYASKLLRRGTVSGGLYSVIRHPQYVALAVLGLGTVLVWPRLLVLLSYVTMLFLYVFLAGWEEKQCLARHGDAYRAYRDRTGMFLPRRFSGRLPSLLPPAGAGRILAALGLYLVVCGGSVILARSARSFSLARVPAVFRDDTAILSPAPLTVEEIRRAYATAVSDPRVAARLREAAPRRSIVYVVPESWRMPDLPLDRDRPRGGHETPEDFDRNLLRVLFTRALTWDAEATGAGIVRKAYGREPIVLARVDLGNPKVTAVETPPAHVRWGDIPTPMF